MTNIFFLSSRDETPVDRFQGLCVADGDLVIGAGGYEKYKSAGRKLRPGMDGSYIIASRCGDETVIGTDGSGYHKLFLYRSGNDWAVSNALIDLASWASGQNLPVTIDEGHLSHFFIRGSFGNQLASLRTSVREISLVPPFQELVIDGQGRLALRLTSESSERASLDYSGLIRRYLSEWVAAMTTVLSVDDLVCQCDLSGGFDSRAVLSLALAARSRGVHTDNIQFRSNLKYPADLAVAHELAAAFGLNLNRKETARLARLSSEASYGDWKSLCLGVYSPIYFTNSQRGSDSIHIGGGGECHRQFYDSPNLAEFLGKRKKFIPSGTNFDRLKADIVEDLHYLCARQRGSLDPFVVHYRNFRSRIHGGLTSQKTNVLSPLSGGSLMMASEISAPGMIENRQILADVMLNAFPHAAMMPYDEASKSLGERHVRNAVPAMEAIYGARTDGKVYCGDQAPDEKAKYSRTRVNAMLHDDFMESHEIVRGTGFFPPAYLEKARQVVETVATQGTFPHAVDAAPISHVILAGELMRLSR